MDELEIVELIRKRFSDLSFSKDPSRILKGIGDDAAVISPSRYGLLYTTDMMVEGIHFDLSFITPFQLGFKLVARNVSDIFAMAGEPEFLLLNICIPMNCKTSVGEGTEGPRSWRLEGFLNSFLEGVEEALKRYNITLIGGDFSSSPHRIYLSATLTGLSDKPVLRSGAMPGDRIYVTGTIGDSACGLEILKRKPDLPSEIKDFLQKRHLMPEPKAVHRKVRKINAMIDISDGLSLDLWRLCRESDRGALIYEEKIPLSPEMKEAAPRLSIDPLKLSLSGGEDYEMLFTTDELLTIEGITEIGTITNKKGLPEIKIVTRDGVIRPLKPEGYIHT